MSEKRKNTPINASAATSEPFELAIQDAPAIKMESLPAEVTDSAWGAIEGMETSDLLVPKIFHQQALSKFVKDGDARPGDFCDSITGTVLAPRDGKLEVIVFASYKTMVISKLNDRTGKYLFDRIVTIGPENAREWADRPFTEEINGESFKNNLTFNYFVLIPSLIKELPYVLSLGSTKTKAAKKLNTMLYKLNTLRRPGASVVFELSSVEESNDSGSWYGLEVNQGRAATPDELLRAHAWYMKSKTQKFVAAEDLETEGSANSSHDATSDDLNPLNY